MTKFIDKNYFPKKFWAKYVKWPIFFLVFIVDVLKKLDFRKKMNKLKFIKIIVLLIYLDI